jgi:hypothetical protein
LEIIKLISSAFTDNIFQSKDDEEEETNTGMRSTLFKELWVLFGGVLF